MQTNHNKAAASFRDAFEHTAFSFNSTPAFSGKDAAAYGITVIIPVPVSQKYGLTIKFIQRPEGLACAVVRSFFIHTEGAPGGRTVDLFFRHVVHADGDA